MEEQRIIIEKVEVQNFRNIKHNVLNLGRVSIISGCNNLGKSNSLNAVNWLLTDTLLTDKYGNGENDIASIIPVNILRGEHTRVSIWLSTHTKYTKILKRGYDKYGKPNKNTTEYEINDSKVATKKEFYDTLYDQLGFTPIFTKLKVDEVRLFTDPYYALLKLDYKELRNLLVAMGCSVSDEELFRTGFEDMRAYGIQYMGKWDVMRKNVKDQVQSIKTKIDEVDSQLKLFNAVDLYDVSHAKELEGQRDGLIAKRTKMQSDGIDNLTSGIKAQIKELELSLNNKKSNKQLEIDKQISSLELEYKNLVSNFEKKKFEATQDVQSKINTAREELAKLKEQLANNSLALVHKNSELSQHSFQVEHKTKEKDKLSEELGRILNEKDEVVCPICGCTYELHKEEHDKQINDIALEIGALEDTIARYKKQCDDVNQDIRTLQVENEDLRVRINDTEQEVQTLTNQRIVIESELSIDTEQRRLDSEISKLRKDKLMVSFPNDENEIQSLREKVAKLEADAKAEIENDVQEIKQQIYALNLEIKNEYDKENQITKKHELEVLREQLIKQWNDADTLLARTNQLIQYMIKCINDKAQAITGFKFVMLEENLTNDSLTECCYVVDDNNVPFKDINTARKVEMGIKFIESVRMQNFNHLPILVDRLEGIDYIDKIKNFSSNQIICTRVSTDNTLNIVNL